MRPSTVFLFGKLPSHGDFVSYGLDVTARAAWDERCTASLADARARLGDDFDAAYEATHPRGFLLAPSGEVACRQIGCVAPSRDRVGRAFPLVIGRLGPDDVDGYEAALVAHLEACLYDAIVGRSDVAETVDRAARLDLGIDVDPRRGDGATIPPWEAGWIGVARLSRDATA